MPRRRPGRAGRSRRQRGPPRPGGRSPAGDPSARSPRCRALARNEPEPTRRRRSSAGRSRSGPPASCVDGVRVEAHALVADRDRDGQAAAPKPDAGMAGSGVPRDVAQRLFDRPGERVAHTRRHRDRPWSGDRHLQRGTCGEVLQRGGEVGARRRQLGAGAGAGLSGIPDISRASRRAFLTACCAGTAARSNATLRRVCRTSSWMKRSTSLERVSRAASRCSASRRARAAVRAASARAAAASSAVTVRYTVTAMSTAWLVSKASWGTSCASGRPIVAGPGLDPGRRVDRDDHAHQPPPAPGRFHVDEVADDREHELRRPPCRRPGGPRGRGQGERGAGERQRQDHGAPASRSDICAPRQQGSRPAQPRPAPAPADWRASG